MDTFDLGFLVAALPYTLYAKHFSPIKICYLLKCIPIIYLIFGIIKQLVNKSKNIRVGYQWKIIIALLASSVGDIYIIHMEYHPKYLFHSIMFFGVAHLFYIWAMGFKHFNISGAFIVILMEIITLVVLFKPISKMNDTFHKAIPLYIFLILMMAWRSIVRGEKIDQRGLSLFGSHSVPYTKLAGISFVISDSILALTDITRIIGNDLINENVISFLVLSTYYFAQYCFAKSAII